MIAPPKVEVAVPAAMRLPLVRRLPAFRLPVMVVEPETASEPVVVALESVAFSAVKFWKVEEPVTRRLAEVSRLVTVTLPPSFESPITSNWTIEVVAVPPTSSAFVEVDGRRPEPLKNVQFTSAPAEPESLPQENLPVDEL